jgi:hypothetical protein
VIVIKPKSRAAIVLREALTAYIDKRGYSIVNSQRIGEEVAGEALAGVTAICALIIKGGHASRDEMVQAMTKALVEGIDRDLRCLTTPT